MKDEQKHTPTPWYISTDGTYIAYYDENNEPQQIAMFIKKENGYFAVAACNSYHTLKQQNEELTKMLEACKIILGISASCMKSDNPTTAATVTKIKEEVTELLTKHSKL